MVTNSIVAFGRTNILRSREYARRRREMIAKVHREYQPRLRVAGPLERLRLKVMRWRKLRRQLDRLAPVRGCYFSSGDKSGL
jgi:hypothetical protein